jgi:hypothetical protein
MAISSLFKGSATVCLPTAVWQTPQPTTASSVFPTATSTARAHATRPAQTPCQTASYTMPTATALNASNTTPYIKETASSILLKSQTANLMTLPLALASTAYLDLPSITKSAASLPATQPTQLIPPTRTALSKVRMVVSIAQCATSTPARPSSALRSVPSATPITLKPATASPATQGLRLPMANASSPALKILTARSLLQPEGVLNAIPGISIMPPIRSAWL